MAPPFDPCGGRRHGLGWTPGDERGRHFRIFWAGQVLSMLGDAFALVALPLLVLELTGSVAKMGLLTEATGAMQIAMGLSAGWIMDRFNRRQSMILCDVGRAILFALVPFWGATIGPSMALVYTVTVLAAALAGLFAVGYVTAIPNLVSPERVTEANGRLAVSLRQQITPDYLLGRVTAAFWTLCFASAPVGAALATWTAERVGVRPVLVVTGGLLALTTAVVGLTPLRLARPETTTHATQRDLEGPPA